MRCMASLIRYASPVDYELYHRHLVNVAKSGYVQAMEVVISCDVTMKNTGVKSGEMYVLTNF